MLYDMFGDMSGGMPGAGRVAGTDETERTMKPPTSKRPRRLDSSRKGESPAGQPITRRLFLAGTGLVLARGVFPGAEQKPENKDPFSMQLILTGILMVHTLDIKRS